MIIKNDTEEMKRGGSIYYSLNIEQLKQHDYRKLGEVYFFGNKGLLMRADFNSNGFDKYTDLVSKCKMIVINCGNANKNIVINRIFEFLNSQKHYGPIIEVGENDVYYFPRLCHEDIYLMKNVLQERFEKEKVNIII